ncbi:hypothetical protein FP435_00265 (plasmid) [Lactobacillus sp. PV037]|uniref:hypothetical protein n=1 Tax=Lactobacillus sp. PV037 TaxID=2594496 RepID=UPI0022407A1F|nr:hypothetical protein [Lactobacillus sp. PV037]QNQ82971.1 hypothetical protein FP435_00265 [Lactobacillus sp. PV037]
MNKIKNITRFIMFGVAVVFIILGMLNTNNAYAIKASSDPGSPEKNKDIVLQLKSDLHKSLKKEIPLKDINFKLVSNRGKVEKVGKLNFYKEIWMDNYVGDKFEYPNTNLNLSYAFDNLETTNNLYTSKNYLWQVYNVKLSNLIPKMKYNIVVGAVYDNEDYRVIRKIISLNTDARGRLSIPLYNSVSLAAANYSNEDPTDFKPSTFKITNKAIDKRNRTIDELFAGSLTIVIPSLLLILLALRSNEERGRNV